MIGVTKIKNYVGKLNIMSKDVVIDIFKSERISIYILNLFFMENI